MKVGSQPLPVAAELREPTPLPRTGPHPAKPAAGSSGDRVELSPEARAALASARTGRAAGPTGEEALALVARANQEASRAARRADLGKLLALLR